MQDIKCHGLQLSADRQSHTTHLYALVLCLLLLTVFPTTPDRSDPRQSYTQLRLSIPDYSWNI